MRGKGGRSDIQVVRQRNGGLEKKVAKGQVKLKGEGQGGRINWSRRNGMLLRERARRDLVGIVLRLKSKMDEKRDEMIAW